MFATLKASVHLSNFVGQHVDNMLPTKFERCRKCCQLLRVNFFTAGYVGFKHKMF